MAKGNLILGTAYNKLGDIVLMRKDGWQQSRVRVRKISNPKTMPQAVNRALLGTIGTAYSYMKAILDHSFQGLSKPVQNQRKFQALAQSIARATGSLNIPSTDEGFNFNFKGEKLLRPNPWPLSRGTMTGVDIEGLIGDNNRLAGFAFSDNYVESEILSECTYSELCEVLGVELGTQLTFCIINDDTFVGTPSGSNVPLAYGNFHFARVILAPDNGDGDEAAIIASGDGYHFASPNSKNQGDVFFKMRTIGGSTRLAIVVNGKEYPIAAGVIVSNYNGKWLRSNTDMIVADGYESSNTISEVYGSYMASEASSYSGQYLNQAAVDAGEESDVPIYVAPPVITGDDQFEDTSSVVITAASGATIYYTLDGSTPTTESTVYSGTVTLSATTTVKAIAVKNNVVSSVATKTFTKSFEG